MSQLDILKLNRIIMVCDEQGAEIFLEKVFPLLGNVCVVSSDKNFPKDHNLNQLVWKKIENDPDLLIVTMNSQSMRSIQAATKNIFHLNDMIMESSLVWHSAEKTKINWDEFRLANIISTVFAQWERKTVRNLSHNYAKDAKYDRQSLGWVLDLIIDHRSSETT